MAAAAGTTAPGSAGTGTLGTRLALAGPILLQAPHTLPAAGTGTTATGLPGPGSAAPGLPGPGTTATGLTGTGSAGPGTSRTGTGTLGTRLALASSTLLDTTGAAPAAGPGLTAPASAPAALTATTGQQSKIIFIMFVRHFQKFNRDSFCL